MFNKKPPSLEGVDALVFYGQRLTLIRHDQNAIQLIWRECSNRKDYKDDLNFYVDATCNRRVASDICPNCKANKGIAKEKRRLKAQFNTTVSKMLEFVPSAPSLCIKVADTFTDIEFKKLENCE